jgi:hypothetical protein
MAKRLQPTYCDDWGCGAKWSCASAWCRSHEYWSFDAEALAQFKKAPRKPGGSDCQEYERDRAREWLRDAFVSQSQDDPATALGLIFGLEGGRC